MSSAAVVYLRVGRATRMMRLVRRLGMAFVLALCGVSLGGVAQAFWSGGGVGFGLATTGTMSSPTNVVATTGFDSDLVSVSWDAATLSTGDAVLGYRVTRMPDEGGESSPACGTSPTTLTGQLQCDDTSVPDGDYRYVVTAVAGSWTSESEPSAPVTVFANVGAPSVATSTSPAANANGYNRTSPVSVDFTATDPDGVASITYTVNSDSPITVNAATASVPLSGDGTYTVTHSAVDTAGNRSPLGTRVVRIDSVPPPAPTAPVLATSSDTGASSTDGITSDRSPTFTGAAEPASTVQFYSGGTLVGAATAGIDGTYTATSTYVLGDGTYPVTVRAVDLAGNYGAFSGTTYFTVDGTAPSTPSAMTLAAASDTGRSSSDRITLDTTPTFAGTGPSGSLGVRLYRDGEEVGTATASPSYTVTAAELADGVHSMTVRVFDLAGNLSAPSAGRAVTIDTVAPEAPSAPSLTTASDTGASSGDRVTNDTTPTVTGSTETSASITLYAGAAQVGTQTTGGTTYSVTSSTLPEGDHTLSATAMDAAGNLGPVSSSTTITIDITAPAAPSAPVLEAGSDSGVSSSDRITNDTTPTFTGTAEPGSNVTLYDGNNASGQPVIAADGSYTATTGTLNTGDRNITARTDPDLAGNVGISPAITVTIDTTAPSTPDAPTLVAASDSGRSSSDRITNDTTPTFYDNGSSGVVGVILYDGGVEVTNGSAAPSYMVTTPELDDGEHSISARVFDTAGNASVSSATRTVTIDTVAPAAPTAPVVAESSDTGASSSDGVTNDATPTMVGSTEVAAEVNLYAGEVEVGTRITTSEGYSVTASTLAEGNHRLTVTATDPAGNVGPASAATTITIDTTAPAAPSAPVLTAASDTGVSSSDRITNDATPTFTGTAASGSNVTLYDGNTPTGGQVGVSDGSWVATTGTLSNGSRTITARTDPDLAGNVGISPSVAVTIDTIAPTVTSRVDSSSPVRFEFRFSQDVQGLTPSDVLLSGTANATTSTIAGGPRNYDITVSGMNRTGTVIVNLGAGVVVDAAGNGNAAMPSTNNVINYTDVVAPTISITRFVAASGQSALVEGTTSTNPGDSGTVTVVLCTTNENPCAAGSTKATLTANVVPTTGAWSVTSGNLGATAALYARAHTTDLSGNIGRTPSTASGPIVIP